MSLKYELKVAYSNCDEPDDGELDDFEIDDELDGVDFDIDDDGNDGDD